LQSLTVNEPVQYTSYKRVVETEYREEDVTVNETVWEKELRERRYVVSKQVPETTVRIEKYTERRPVVETEYRDESYDVVKTVPETSEREERSFVTREVPEMQNREIVTVKKMPVEKTVMQEKRYTVNRPITTYKTQTVDRGRYEEAVTANPQKSYTRLAWQPAGEYVDSDGVKYRRLLPGLAWTEMESTPTYSVEKVYKPNLVEETIPVTTSYTEEVSEQVPVLLTTYEEVQEKRIEPVKVLKQVTEEVVRKVPVTTYRNVTERVEKVVPYQVHKFVEEECEREVPVTTYKTVTEERVETYEVSVPRIVTTTKKVTKPVTVEKVVPVSYTVNQPKTIVNRIPISGTESVVSKVSETATPTRAIKLAPGETLVSQSERVISKDEAATQIVAKPQLSPDEEANDGKVIETQELPTYKHTEKPAPITIQVIPTPDPADSIPSVKLERMF
jgi:hypothetical protein